MLDQEHEITNLEKLSPQTESIERLNTMNTGFPPMLICEGCSTKGSNQTAQPYVSSSFQKCFHLDAHIPDVLVFPPSTPLVERPLYSSGHIILQDKVSALTCQQILIWLERNQRIEKPKG